MALIDFAVVQGSSPHTRGAPNPPQQHRRHSWIIPAYAGSTPSTSGQIGGDADHPRIRGEHSILRVRQYMLKGSSPHTRGAPQSHQKRASERRIIPAYAGSTARRRCPAGPPTDHPRIRGEHFGRDVQVADETGSSPHTRGAPGSVIHCAHDAPDHPRIRGEHHPSTLRRVCNDGSSPHTRGARRHGHSARC